MTVPCDILTLVGIHAMSGSAEMAKVVQSDVPTSEKEIDECGLVGREGRSRCAVPPKQVADPRWCQDTAHWQAVDDEDFNGCGVIGADGW